MGDLILSEKNVVTRANKLVEARYKLEMFEQRVVYAIVSCIQPSIKEFIPFEFDLKEFAKFIGVPELNAIRDMKTITRRLLSRVIIINHGGDDETELHWVSKVKYKKGKIIFFLDDELKPYLIELKNFFGSVKVSELISFRSAHSARIYEILLMNLGATKKYQMEFTINEFKEKLGIKQKEYPLFANLKAKVLEVAMKDINNKDLKIPWEVSYDTRKVDGRAGIIIFTLKRKEIEEEAVIKDDGKPPVEEENIDEKFQEDEERYENSYDMVERAIQNDINNFLAQEAEMIEQQQLEIEEEEKRIEEEYRLSLERINQKKENIEKQKNEKIIDDDKREIITALITEIRTLGADNITAPTVKKWVLADEENVKLQVKNLRQAIANKNEIDDYSLWISAAIRDRYPEMKPKKEIFNPSMPREASEEERAAKEAMLKARMTMLD